MIRFAEVLILLVVCYLAFFTHLRDHDYIKTESLRAVVVEEMLERGGPGMPTVHHTPYLKKPPLYAWTTATLAEWMGRFDPEVARLPSAFFGTCLVLLMYLLGETWIGRGGGFAAGVMTLLNPTVTDYAVRAELDLPFSFFCAAGLALTVAALRRRGARAVLFWLAAYAFALIAAMWKGPHSLIFMWLTMFGYALIRRDWSFLKSPAQWGGLVVVLALLVWWAQSLSDFAGPSRVGRAAGIELLVRLVPYKPQHFIEMLTFIPLLIVVTLPASAFALLSFRGDVRSLSGLSAADAKTVAGSGGLKAGLRGWWGGLKSNPFGVMLLAWFIPNLVFMLIAPAKAPRYSMPIFPPVFLLGAWIMVMLEAARDTSDVSRHATRVWRGVFAVFAMVGVFGLVRLVAGFAGVTFGMGGAENHRPWLILAVGFVLPIVVEVTRLGGRSLRTRLILCLIVLLAVQPVLHGVWWPLRVEADSQREAAQRIANIVPAGERVYVLGKHEFPDTQMYADRAFFFAGSIREAVEESRPRPAYVIVRADELDELTPPDDRDGLRLKELMRFERADSENLFISVLPNDVPAAATNPAGEP